MDYKIRLVQNDDCKKLARLKHTIWETTYRGIYPDEIIDNFDFEKQENSFKNIVNNPKIEFYVLEIDGEMVGYMDCGEPHYPFDCYTQDIGLMYILKKYQGMGFGRKLFELGVSRIKEKGHKNFFVACNKRNINAQKFYEKMGGKIIHVDGDLGDKSREQIIFLYEIK